MGYKSSFFNIVSATLNKYNLPSILQLPQYTKLEWKRVTKTAIGTYWTSHLTEDAKQKSTLDYCNVTSLRIGHTHPVWDTVNPNTNDVKMGITKARLLTGTYLLQSNKAKFNKYDVNGTCPLCRLEIEDREHMITRCPALISSRNRLMQEIRQIVVDKFGQDIWNQISTRHNITKLIIDCTTLATMKLLPDNVRVLDEIEKLSRKLCHKIHIKRLKELRKLNK